MHDIIVTLMEFGVRGRNSITCKSNPTCLYFLSTLNHNHRKFIVAAVYIFRLLYSPCVTIFNGYILLHFLDHNMLLILRYTISFITAFQRGEEI